MVSFEIQLSKDHPPVLVYLPSNDDKCVTQDELSCFPAFKTWLSTLQTSLALQSKPDHTFHASPYALREIQIQSIDRFGGKRLGFVKLTATVSNDDGEKLPGSVFLRGGSVAMLVILQPDYARRSV